MEQRSKADCDETQPLCSIISQLYLNKTFKIKKKKKQQTAIVGNVAQMAKQEAPELNSSHGHTTITTTDRATTYENDLKMSRKDKHN